MNRKYVVALAALAFGTVAAFSYQNLLAEKVSYSLKEGMQRDINRAVTDLFIMKGEFYPSINMFYRFAGKSALFLNAHYAKNQGRYQEAGDFLSLLADKENSSVDILKQTYVSLALAGRVDEAVKYAEKAKSLGGDDIVTEIVIISEAAKKGDFAKVRNILDNSRQAKYNAGLVNLLKAWAFAGETQYDKALQTLEKVKEDKAFAGPYAFHKALIQDLAGKNKEAADSYLAVLGKHGETASIRSLQASISFFRRNGRPDKARELLNIYNRNPAHFANVGKDLFWTQKEEATVKNAAAGMAESILGIATNYTAGSDAAVGVLFLRIALYLDDNLLPAKVLLAEVLERLNLYDEAIKVYASLPKGGNLYASSQIQMIKLLIEQKRFEQAKEALDTVKQQYGDDVSLLIVQGDIDRAQNNVKSAAENYTKAIEKIGKESDVPANLYAARGIVLAESEKWEQAESDLLKALIKNPADSYILNYLGYTWMVDGKNLDQAEKMIKIAAEKSPDDGSITDSLGWLYYLKGDIEKSVEVLEKAVQQMPAHSIINNHLGDAYWKAGRKREAVFQWEKAIKLNHKIKPEEIQDIKFKIDNGLEAFLQKNNPHKKEKAE